MRRREARRRTLRLHQNRRCLRLARVLFLVERMSDRDSNEDDKRSSGSAEGNPAPQGNVELTATDDPGEPSAPDAREGREQPVSTAALKPRKIPDAFDLGALRAAEDLLKQAGGAMRLQELAEAQDRIAATLSAAGIPGNLEEIAKAVGAGRLQDLADAQQRIARALEATYLGGTSLADSLTRIDEASPKVRETFETTQKSKKVKGARHSTQYGKSYRSRLLFRSAQAVARNALRTSSLAGVGVGTTEKGAVGISTERAMLDVDKEVTRLRREVEDLATKLDRSVQEGKSKDEDVALLNESVRQLTEKTKLSGLIARVSASAGQRLEESNELRNQFVANVDRKAFVLAADIRRSTELMLKARSAQEFAAFISTLCGRLGDVVKDHQGVVDAFTGDGLLAYFTEEFSGADAGYLAVSAAQRCHAVFDEHYSAFRSSFNSVLLDVGLGIGMDWGTVTLVDMVGGPTVVGVPVVYACRMAAAPAGVTLLNQAAFEKIHIKCATVCTFKESRIDLRHEGAMLAYEVSLVGREHAAEKPDWFK